MISGIIEMRVQLVSVLSVSMETLTLKMESAGGIKATKHGYQDPRDRFEVALKSLRDHGEHSSQGMLGSRLSTRGISAYFSLLHGSQHHGLKRTGNKRTEKY